MRKKPKLNALVNLLFIYNPNTLEELRKRYPDQQDLLTPGQVLGDFDVDQKAIIELVSAALDTLLNQIDVNLEFLRRRLIRARNIRFVGNIIGTFSSVGIISAVLSATSNLAIIIVSSINFISSVFLLVSQHFQDSFLGEGNSLQKLFDELTQIIPKAMALDLRLKLSTQNLVNNENLIELAQEANALVAEARRIEVMIGTARRFSTHSNSRTY